VRLRPDLAGWMPAPPVGKGPSSEDAGLKISSADAQANLDLAALFSAAGDDSDAVRILKNLAGLNGIDGKASASIAKAKDRLQTATPSKQNSPLLAGIDLLRNGHFREAQTPLSEASAKNANPSLRLFLVRSYLEAGDYGPAEAEVRKILKADPDNVDALHLLGRNYKRQAEAALEQMSAIDADSYGVHELLGRQHEERTEFELAIQEYQKALAKRPDAGGIRYAIGNVYRKMSRYDQAEHWLAEEIQGNPYHGMAQYRLGTVYIEEGKPEEAIPHLEVALRAHPRLTDARMDLGRAYTAKGRYAEAIAALKQVAVSEPDNDRVHYLLSTAYSKQGNREEAQAELAAYQRLTRLRLQRTQQDVRNAGRSVDGK
jgi:tetratricopeptide (TPR) repeat protein